MNQPFRNSAPGHKHCFALFFMLLFSGLFAQELPQKKLDSLESVLFSLENTDTTRIVQTGMAILKGSSSQQRQFRVLEKISETYFRINNLNKSIAYSFRAKEAAEKSGSPELMAQAYGSIANQYSYLNLSEKSRPYLNRAIAQIEKMPAGDKKYQLKALSFLELGKLDFNNDNYAGANKNFKQSLVQFDRIKGMDKTSNYHYRRSLYNIGNSYYYLKQPDSAEAYLNRALAIKDRQSPDLKYFIYSTLAEVYTLRGSHSQAIDTLQAVLHDKDFNINPLKAEIYLNLSRNYQRIGDKANYTLYNEKHLSLRDTVEGNERKAINTAFTAEQKGFSDSVLESKQHVRWLIYCVLLVVLASIGLIFYLNRKKKREHAIYLSVIEKLKGQIETAQQTENTQPVREPQQMPSVKANASIPETVASDILAGLQKFEQEERFRNPKLTIAMLAVELDTNPAYVSAVIKMHKDKNFNAYINELRIGYICRKIHTHREYVNYKISYLAEDCGFASHSIFSTIFKKVTGISPSVFLEEEEKYHRAHSVR